MARHPIKRFGTLGTMNSKSLRVAASVSIATSVLILCLSIAASGLILLSAWARLPRCMDAKGGMKPVTKSVPSFRHITEATHTELTVIRHQAVPISRCWEPPSRTEGGIPVSDMGKKCAHSHALLDDVGGSPIDECWGKKCADECSANKRCRTSFGQCHQVSLFFLSIHFLGTSTN